jgi:hypothetical protein
LQKHLPADFFTRYAPSLFPGKWGGLEPFVISFQGRQSNVGYRPVRLRLRKKSKISHEKHETHEKKGEKDGRLGGSWRSALVHPTFQCLAPLSPDKAQFIWGFLFSKCFWPWQQCCIR